MHTYYFCHLSNLNVGRQRYSIGDLSQTLEVHEGQVFSELIPPIGWRDEIDPVHHVEVVVTGLRLVCHRGLMAPGPGDHLRAQLTGEELVHESGQTLGSVVMVKALSPILFFFGRFRCWTPVPQLCTKTLYQKVESLSDVGLDRVLQNKSFVCPEKEKNVH